MGTIMTFRLAALATMPLCLAACSPLLAFDALVPKDRVSTVVAKDVAYAAPGRAKLDIYAPKSGHGVRHPVMIYFYGGSWNSGTKDGYDFVGRALAGQGFLTFVPDYRLIPEVEYPTFLRDCAAAVKWVRANAARYGGDPDRLILIGHSAGAYNAAMLSLDPQWLGNDREAIRGFVGMAGPYSFLPLDTKVTIRTFGAVDDLPSTQPIHFASADDPPALLLGGEKDGLVFASNSVALAMRLSEASAKVETRIYPDIGHVGIISALARPLRSRANVVADISAFAHSVASNDFRRR